MKDLIIKAIEIAMRKKPDLEEIELEKYIKKEDYRNEKFNNQKQFYVEMNPVEAIITIKQWEEDKTIKQLAKEKEEYLKNKIKSYASGYFYYLNIDPETFLSLGNISIQTGYNRRPRLIWTPKYVMLRQNITKTKEITNRTHLTKDSEYLELIKQIENKVQPYTREMTYSWHSTLKINLENLYIYQRPYAFLLSIISLFLKNAHQTSKSMCKESFNIWKNITEQFIEPLIELLPLYKKFPDNFSFTTK